MDPTAGKIRQRLDRRLDRVRANFWCHVTRGAFASSGGQLIGGTDFLAVLVTVLGFQPVVLGFLTTMQALGQLLQLFTAPRIEAVPRKKRLIVYLDLCKWVPPIVCAIALVLYAQEAPVIALVVIAAVTFIMAVAGTVTTAPELDLIAETVPSQLVSKIFGFSNALSAAIALTLAALVGLLLDQVAFPFNYSSVYLVTAIVLMLSWLAFRLVDEIPQTKAQPSRQRSLEYFGDLFRVLRDDRRYRIYLTYEALRKIGVYSGVFYTLVAVQHHGVDPAFAVGTFLAVRQVAYMSGFVGFPLLSARIGLRPVLAIGVLLYASAAIGATIATSGIWFAAVIFTDALGSTITQATGTAFAIRIYPSQRRVGYVTLTSLVFTPLGILLPLSFGLAIQTFGYVPVFWTSAMLLFASLIPLSRCVAGERD